MRGGKHNEMHGAISQSPKMTLTKPNMESQGRRQSCCTLAFLSQHVLDSLFLAHFVTTNAEIEEPTSLEELYNSKQYLPMMFHRFTEFTTRIVFTFDS